MDTLKRCRLLIVDDDELMRSTLQKLFVHHGAEVHVAVSGKRALDVLEEEIFDALILDIQLAGIDGFQVARSVRASSTILFPAVPILALSGNIDRDINERCVAAGFSGFFLKPSELDALINELEHAINPRYVCTLDFAALKNFPDFDEMKDLFRKTILATLERLNEAIRIEEGETVREQVHKMKSSARLFGATSLGELCEDVERNARSMPARERLKKILEINRLANYVLEDLESRG